MDCILDIWILCFEVLSLALNLMGNVDVLFQQAASLVGVSSQALTSLLLFMTSMSVPFFCCCCGFSYIMWLAGSQFPDQD